MFDKLKSGAAAFLAVVSTALIAGTAHAGELADAVTDNLDKAEMTAIGVGILALCGVVVLIKKAQRASGG